MTDKDLIELLRSKQICTGFKPDGHGDVGVVYGPDPVTAEAADRIEALTAERDRYRKALEDIIADCEADYPPSHGAIKYAARDALKGETP